MEAPTTIPTIVHAKSGALEEFEAALAADPSTATAVNDNGRSALSLAAQYGHLKIVSKLLDVGASDSEVAGWTAAMHAAFNGHSEVLAKLISKLGAAVALAPPSGSTTHPLLLAATKGRVACLSLLLDALPDSVNQVVDAHGRTALMCAASSGSAEAVELLVQRGAELDTISADGKSALMWAVTSVKPATTAALARLGANADVAAPLPDVIVPGQDRSKGETAEDLSNAKHAKDPTLRHMAKFMTAWRVQRTEDPSGPLPEMGALAWMTHAEEFVVKQKAEAEAAATKAAMDADEPMIEEVGSADDDNDIFGDAAPAEAEAVPVGGGEEAALKAEAEDAQKAVAANADLDELD